MLPRLRWRRTVSRAAVKTSFGAWRRALTRRGSRRRPSSIGSIRTAPDRSTRLRCATLSRRFCPQSRLMTCAPYLHDWVPSMRMPMESWGSRSCSLASKRATAQSRPRLPRQNRSLSQTQRICHGTISRGSCKTLRRKHAATLTSWTSTSSRLFVDI